MSPDFQKVLVHGHLFDFSPSIINQFLQCPNPVGPQPISDLQDVVSVLTHGKLLSWPAKGNLPLVDLSLRYCILHKMHEYLQLASEDP